MPPLLELRSVDKSFANADGIVSVLSDFSLSLPPGEFLSILGPSGCGKSTILRILAGLEFPDQGKALFAGRLITEPEEKIGFMFQSYDCFPWKTVAENVKAGLLRLNLAEDECEKRVLAVLDRVYLSKFRNSFPRQLSGGMKQRVALVRTIISTPSVLLLDEPFGALDIQLRSRLQDFISELFVGKAIEGIVLATHDISEAVRMSTRILLLGPRPAQVIYEATTKRANPSAPEDQELIDKCREMLALKGLVS